MNKYIFLFLFVSTSMYSQESFDYSSFQVNKNYTDGCLTQFDFTQNALHEYNRADTKLNEIYNKILIKYKDNIIFIEKLKIAQRAWMVFRDAHTDSIWIIDSPKKELYWGSMYSESLYIESANLTWERVKQLIKWLDLSNKGPGSYGVYTEDEK
jgi:uncharacterized protein YecT (DUF1311 family)